MRASSVCCAVSSCFLLLIAGCGAGTPTGTLGGSSTAVPTANHTQGTVMGGQQPVSGAVIQLYAVSTTADGAASTPVLTRGVATDSNGNFGLTGLYTCPSSSSLMYVTATGGNPGAAQPNGAIALMTALGACGSLTSSTRIMIDERTTVAAVAALAPFMTSPAAVGSSAVDANGLATAFTLASSYVSPSTGQIPGPGLPANAAAPAALINTLANVIAACINSTGGAANDGTPCGTLFADTTPSGAAAPANTISALLNIMRDPQANAAALYALDTPSAPFQPQLAAAPTDWTMALSGSGAPAPVPYGCTAADLTGNNSFTNYMLEQPGICRHMLVSDLPAPDTNSSSNNTSTLVARAPGQMPVVPPGFKVTLYATYFCNARYLMAIPNGDLLLSEPGCGDIKALRGVDANGAAQHVYTYTTGLNSPYGMALYPSAANPQYLYVANTSSIVRFPYSTGDTAASASPATLATDIPGSGHSTRALAFTPESTPRLLVSVGSADNINDVDANSDDFHRADILAYTLGTNSLTFQSIFASGLRNPVGLVYDSYGKVWTSVNERDGLGDNTPAEYVTHVQEGGFYGWPYFYNAGTNPEPRLPSHANLASSVITGDVLLQAHFAPLQINFYTGTQFPKPYRGDLFVASHGSWNKSVRGGYELVRVRMKNGVATGEYEDFMTGFVNPDGTVWGRPAGVATGADGALYVVDDATNSVWRITYTGQ